MSKKDEVGFDPESSTLEDVQKLVKLIKAQNKDGNSIIKLQEYDKLQKLCQVKSKLVNRSACNAIIYLHYSQGKLTTCIEEVVNSLTTLIPDAKDSSGLIHSIVILLMYQKENCIGKQRDNKMKLKFPLNSILATRPELTEKIVYLIEDILEDQSRFEIFVPFFKRILCLPGDEQIMKHSFQIWRIIIKANNTEFLYSCFFWSGVHDCQFFKRMILEAESIIKQETGFWCLLLTLLIFKLSAEGYFCQQILNRLSEVFVCASDDIQLVIIISILHTMYKCLPFNFQEMLQFIKPFIMEMKFGCEIKWIFIATFLKYMKRLPDINMEHVELVDEIYNMSSSQENICFNKEFTVMEESLCIRFPELAEALSITSLLAELEGDEDLVLQWISSIPSTKCITTGEEIVLSSFLVGGTESIKAKSLNVLCRTSVNPTMLIFLISKEESCSQLKALLQALCMTTRDENEELVLQKLINLETSQLKKPILFMLAYSVWKDTNPLNAGLEMLLKKKYNSTVNIILQAILIKRILKHSNSYSCDFVPALVFIIERTRNNIKWYYACSKALDAICLLIDKGLVQYDIILQVTLKNLIHVNHISIIRKGLVRILKRAPIHSEKHSVITASLQILWSFVIDKQQICPSAYKALRNFNLSDFTKKLLPINCSSHLTTNGESENIPAPCWVHLLKSASSFKRVSNEFKYLLRKDLRTSKTFIPENSGLLFQGLWNFVNQFYNKGKKYIDTIELCLLTLRGQFTSIFPIKAFYSLDYFISDKDDKLKVHAVVMLIRQAFHHKQARNSLEDFINSGLFKGMVRKK